MACRANSKMPLQLQRSALFIALAFPLAATTQAETAKRLDDVVVSAAGFEQDVKEAPASISVITRQELETKQFRDLAEALAGVEGIDVMSSTGKAGGLSISIRGMPSEYSLILIDGRRQNVAGDATPNGFGDALNSFMPPVSAIERIEVIRGPMSTLYGSDAMGGVVNIITRKVAKKWNGSVTVEAGIPEDSKFGATKKINVYASGPIQQDVLGIVLRANTMNREGGDRIIPNELGRDPNPAESRQYSFGTRLNLTPSKGNEFWLDLSHGYTWYNNKDCRLGTRDLLAADCATPSTTVSGYQDYMSIVRNDISLGHKTRLPVGIWESSLMHSTTETEGRTLPVAKTDPARNGDPRDLRTTNMVLDTKLITPLGNQHLATFGGQWWDAELKDGLLPQQQFKQNMWSLFIEDEWRFAKDFAATLGVRYDEHDRFGGQVSPRAYLVWNTTPNWTIKGGVSEGYRAPRINQLIDGVSGISGQGKNISIGNPSLKPETSRSTELGVLFDNRQGLTSSATLFHNEFKEKIVSGEGDCKTDWISSCTVNPTAKYARNVDQAKTWGMELATRIPLADRWSLNMNYTHTETEVTKEGEVTGKLANTPKHMANAQLRWAATERANVWLRAEYRGKSRRFTRNELDAEEQAELSTMGDMKAYTLLHLGGSYKASKTLSFHANIFNLLDKNFTEMKTWTYGGDQYVGNDYFRGLSGVARTGRTFWLSATVNF